MDNPQYEKHLFQKLMTKLGFKPYYKWITLNTDRAILNHVVQRIRGFKPYYKWITLNTYTQCHSSRTHLTHVLNLIING